MVSVDRGQMPSKCMTYVLEMDGIILQIKCVNPSVECEGLT
jgi:hypothetical protein